MLLESRWRQTARTHARDLAVHETGSGRSWTFAQLEALADSAPLPKDRHLLHPSGRDIGFLGETLRAWRSGSPICPLEPGQEPFRGAPPGPEITLLKQTSGSTRSSRGVALTAAQVVADADQIVTTMGLSPDQPNLGVISLAHSYGFANLVLPLLLHGIPLILVDSALPEAVRMATEPWARLTLPAVPALWRTWLEADSIPPNIRLAISAGAPLPLAIEHQALDRLGLKIHNFLGASECGGIAYDRSTTARPDASFVGRPMDGVSLTCGDRGQLMVESPAVASTYWPTPEPSLGNGRFVTSDLARIDTEGFLWIVGREDDLINVAGRKVSPERIEQILMSMRGVRDCLALGIPDESGRGQCVGVVYSAADGISETTLRTALADRLAAWELPRRWWRRDSLGSDVRGKRSRKAWREQLLGPGTRDQATS
ncbi:MAG: acyl--CoA ligase [Verrucomicrobia bacterium]|nr:acyl--CoA ligase [Verrucomicrobiota bacterium]